MTVNMRRYLLLAPTVFGVLAFCSLLLGTVATAQPPERFGSEVQVTEVLLDVLVTDDDGSVVIGLDKDDFVVEEDGESIEVASMSFYSNRRFLESLGGAVPGLEPEQVPQDRFFVLFFYRPLLETDLMLKLADAGRQAERWVRRDLMDGDYVAVVAYDGRLRLHRDFTTDRDALGYAIRRAAANKEPEGEWPSRAGDRAVPVLLETLPRGDELRDATPTIYKALEVLAGGLERVVGRKNIVFFGIDLPQYHGTPESPDAIKFPPTARALNDANTAFYAIPVFGRYTQNQLTFLADATGGRAITQYSRFSDALQQIAQENSGYYLLSYTRQRPAGVSGYQEVTVRVENPELNVRSRGGYAYGQE